MMTKATINGTAKATINAITKYLLLMIVPLQLLFDQLSFLRSAERGVDHPPVVAST